ncbi:Fic family protein [Curtobacterium luteum]|uniref:Fic family protein n=1 Tax=Curtobacterium luteum TaxID=33881 RepID=A0A8H9L2T2_9MICO|nr:MULTISPECIES: Fic family protein [Curtobacterium]MBM7803421.1 Fic family protein [Curtobacterium luteum]NUU49586.1 Fic family protein [Curtobacterium luteum]GGL11160.1 Fic family protein [Curtobacterium luteum]
MPTTLDWEERWLPRPENPDFDSRRIRALRGEPYRAAVPPEIAAAEFTIASRSLSDADDATRAIARFDAEYASFPVPFAAVLLRSESASSSEIEHLTAGARAIAEAEIDERVQGNAPLIVRNVRAMEAAVALADDLGIETIIAMHEELLRDQTPRLVGGFRDQQVWIGGSLPHLAAFVPPHQEQVPAAMDDLIAFTSRTDLPLLVLAAIAHAQFETIHPFPDGNGRTGRALVQAILRRGGLLRHLTIPVSSGILTDVDGYFGALDAYRAGKVEPIIDVFSSASLAGLRNASTLAADIRGLQEQWGGRLAGLRTDATARRIARLSIEHPVLNARLAIERTGSSAPAVANGFAQLVDRGVLRPANSKQRNRVWVNDEVVEALDAFAARSGRRQVPTA